MSEPNGLENGIDHSDEDAENTASPDYDNTTANGISLEDEDDLLVAEQNIQMQDEIVEEDQDDYEHDFDLDLATLGYGRLPSFVSRENKRIHERLVATERELAELKEKDGSVEDEIEGLVKHVESLDSALEQGKGFMGSKKVELEDERSLVKICMLREERDKKDMRILNKDANTLNEQVRTFAFSST